MRKPIGLRLAAPLGAALLLLLLGLFVPAITQDFDLGSAVFWTLLMVAGIGFLTGLVWLIVNLVRG